MAERRSKVSIFMDILRAIDQKGGRARPTHILYGANLSYDRLKKYLEYLEKEGLKAKVGSGDHLFYETTDKGLDFLGGYNKMKKFFDAFGFNI